MGGITRYHRRPPRFLLFRPRLYTRDRVARTRPPVYLLPRRAAGPCSFLLVKAAVVQDTPGEKGPRGGGFRGSRPGR